MFKWFLWYLLVVNVFGFCLMGLDKRKARKHQWRIPERRLFAAALLGGSLGCILGMHLFRHKTRHKKFIWGMPAIFLAQAILFLGWYYMKYF